MKIGAHVSAAGGLGKVAGRAEGIGAEAVQIFASSPRAWRFKEHSDKDVAAYRENAEATGIDITFLHGIYLVNLGGGPDLLEKSVDSLTNHMTAASRIGAEGVVFHCGSHKNAGFEAVFEQAVRAIAEVLERSPSDTQLIIENSAGMGFHMGASFEEIGRLVKAVGSDQVKVCLDTEHTFAAGYNLADPEAIDGSMDEFDREIGLDRLVVVHANDAKVEFGSGVDRHENIGEGYIGIEGFEVIMGHPAFSDIPFLLEVPGFEKKGPDKENVDRLKGVRSRLGIPA